MLTLETWENIIACLEIWKKSSGENPPENKKAI